MDEFRYSRREFGPFSNYPEFKFKIWDFGGQEDFYTTHQCFLSTLALYLLVWNLQEGKQKKKPQGEISSFDTKVEACEYIWLQDLELDV